jgi:hypothetical protein
MTELAPVDEPSIASAVITDCTQAPDPRADLRAAHRDRDTARDERDRLAEVLERSRAELQQFLDKRHEHEAAHAAEVARFVEARADALLAGDADVAERLPELPDETEL